MTAIYYPNLVARSPNGAYQLEARSPDNEGSRSGERRNRSFQRDFLFRLRDLSRGRVVWERRQSHDEQSPGEVVVGNDGWSIIRTHGFSNEVIAVDPCGEDAMRIGIVGSKTDELNPGTESPASGSVWIAKQMSFTTAGDYWSGNSWRYFVTVGSRRYFVWRTSWGDRLVLDLNDRKVVSPNARLAASFQKAESEGSFNRLRQLRPLLGLMKKRLAADDTDDDEADELSEWIQSASAAISLVGVHRVRDAVTLLREWERLEIPGSMCSTWAFGGRWWLCRWSFRAITRHSLQRLGEQLESAPPCLYAESWDGPRLEAANNVADREAKLSSIRRPMSGMAILKLVGNPDHVGHVVSCGESFEQWEYDVLVSGVWRTKCLQWDYSGGKPELAAVIDAPIGRAISDERLNDILGF
jgi:hypothetical protein